MLFRPPLIFVTLLSTAATSVYANTEKAIFLGPPAVNDNVPSAAAAAAAATLEDLQIYTLTPDDPQVRTHLDAQFPSTSYPKGKPTWLALAGLAEGRRYEVRVCWAATQPTAFRLDTFELPTILDSPVMMSDLSVYSLPRRAGAAGDVRDWSQLLKPELDANAAGPSKESSALFLRILTTADYYTTNKTLMTHVPPIYVDIILDPFILNVLPRSLVPTVGYVVVVAAVSWLVARRIATGLSNVVAVSSRDKKEQ